MDFFFYVSNFILQLTEKNFLKKSKFGSFKSKKISQLVSEGENLTNLENRIHIQ